MLGVTSSMKIILHLWYNFHLSENLVIGSVNKILFVLYYIIQADS